MQFVATGLDGAYLIQPNRLVDERGWFTRTYCEAEFVALGLDATFPQCNLSHNARRGTLRGLHYQDSPTLESKIVRCAVGAVYDVLIDMRVDSDTRFQWIGVELSRSNGHALYVPAGVAHGFITLTNDVDVEYQMGSAYCPSSGRGVRWDDPFFNVAWPIKPRVIADRDANYPNFEPAVVASLEAH